MKTTISHASRNQKSPSVKPPKISVIIPIFHTEREAERLVESLKPTYPNLEIIPVIDQTGAGPSATRNRGLDQATGDYIVFIDSDDTVDRRFIQKLVDKLIAEDATLVSTGFRYHRLATGTTEDTGTTLPPPQRSSESDRAYILRLLVTTVHLYASINKIFRADLIRNHNLKFNERLRFAEDTQFVLNYLQAALADDLPLRLAVLPEPLYHYNYGTPTSTVAGPSTEWRNWQQSYDFVKKWLGPRPSRRERFWLRLLLLRWRISCFRARRRAKQLPTTQ